MYEEKNTDPRMVEVLSSHHLRSFPLAEQSCGSLLLRNMQIGFFLITIWTDKLGSWFRSEWLMENTGHHGKVFWQTWIWAIFVVRSLGGLEELSPQLSFSSSPRVHCLSCPPAAYAFYLPAKSWCLLGELVKSSVSCTGLSTIILRRGTGFIGALGAKGM